MEDDLQEETQEEIRAEEAHFQEDSWSEEETTPGWQEHYRSSSLGIALKQNSS